MKKILAIIQPFTIQQKVYVIYDNDIISTHNFPLVRIYDDIFTLAKKANVREIVLIGLKEYNQHIKEELEIRDTSGSLQIKFQ